MPTTVAGPVRRARLPGGEDAPSPSSARPAPRALLDPPGAAPLPPRKRAPTRVSAGSAPINPSLAPAAPESAARRRYPHAPVAPAAPEPAPMQINLAEPPEPVLAMDPATPAPAMAAPTLDAPETPTAASASKAPAAASAPRRAPAPARAARNALVGLCLTYMDRLSDQIGSPIGFVLKHWALLLIASAHLSAPIGLAWLAAHSSPQAAELFLQGGLLANAGKLLWLYVGCAFVWSVLYIGVARLGGAMRGDLTRFERLGRSLFGPHSKE